MRKKKKTKLDECFLTSRGGSATLKTSAILSRPPHLGFEFLGHPVLTLYSQTHNVKLFDFRGA